MNVAVETVAERGSRTELPRAPRAACLRWSWRAIRRGAMLMWLTVAAYLSVEVISYRKAYPDEASRAKLLELSSSTAVRMLQGVPSGVSSAGGFAVWDSGWMLMLIVASWAMLVTTRLTRGEEDSGRIELLLSRPVTARHALVSTLASMAMALTGIAIAAALPLIVFGEPPGGALLWGAGLGSFGAVVAALAAVCGQLVEPRRRAASLGLALAGTAFLLRVVANSAASRAWLLSVAPFGWLDRLRAFSDNRWLWLAAPGLSALALAALATWLCGRRDTGAALLRSPQSRTPRLRRLTSATTFGWRLTSGALLAWVLGCAVTCLVFGLMIGAIVDFIATDDTYRTLLESMGLDMSVPVIGFISYIAVFMALPCAAFVGWRLGAVRQEESDGRLDNLLVRGVIRWRWLARTAALAFVAAALLVAGSGLGLWAGARLVNAPVSAAQVVQPVAGLLPLVALYTGIAVLSFGLAPRLTVAVPVTLAVLGYLLDTFGAMLSWPGSVLALSPFHHLARLPGSPMTATALVVMSGLGVTAAAAGIVAFSRRDLRGA